MKKTLLASTGALSILGLAAAAPAFAQDMAHSYEITVTNTMATEFIAPILVAGTGKDSEIFAGSYVTPEAESQVLTGDPKMLAARIGEGATVAHGKDGPPEVLLAPGHSLTFTLKTAEPEVRIFAMVAPTEKPDNYLTATVKLGMAMDDKMAAKPMADTMAKDTMAKDTMAKDTMAKDAMAKDTMTTGAMAKDSMSKDTMANDAMAKDAMAKDEMMAKPAMIPAGRTLRMGSHGKRVAMLRERLGAKAMGAGADVYDADLKSAVMEYQSKAGLHADGVVGPMTLKSLNSHAMMEDTMAKDTMMDDKAMAADTMAKDGMAKDGMAKDTMSKDAMAKDAMMDEAMATPLHRFDIGHDENTRTITSVEGTFGTVTVKQL
jgi:pentapeptide MXKDX repeat protein